MDILGKIVGFIVGAVVVYFAITLLFAIPVYFLWNWLMPQIFGLIELTLVQSWGILMLSSFIFKSGNITKKGE